MANSQLDVNTREVKGNLCNWKDGSADTQG